MTNAEYAAIDFKAVKIKISCQAADTLPLDAIEEFQGNLKKRSKKDIDKIIRSIVEYGFSFPFFVWQGEGHNYCLDGHGRILALAEMRRRGTDLPMFPVSYIDAVDEVEAKQKLLRLNSQYGQMTLDSVMEFADGMELNGDELELSDGGIMEIQDKKKLDLDFTTDGGTMKDALDHFDMTLTFEKEHEEIIKALEEKIGKQGIEAYIIDLANKTEDEENA